jgi:hypothetical protein
MSKKKTETKNVYTHPTRKGYLKTMKREPVVKKKVSHA